MKIIIDQPNHDDIIIEEILEPQGACYVITSNDTKIYFSEYQLNEFLRICKIFEE